MTKSIGRLALALVALAAGAGAAAAGHAAAAHADTAGNCHQYQFQSRFLELSQGVAANRLDQENALPTDAKATWCLVPVSNVASAFQVVNKQTGDCMFTRGDLGGPIYAQPCIGQLGEARVTRASGKPGTGL
jgi:hypothetical protein